MKIRKAMKLAWENMEVRRASWEPGLYCAIVGLNVAFYDATGKLDEDYYLDVQDLLADDWEAM